MRVTIPELSLVLLIGPSGSGKTTFAAKHFRTSEVLNLDAVRQMIADGDRDEGSLEAAWDALVELAARRMSLGRLTVIDADLVAASRRQPLLELAAQNHYIAVAMVFAIPEPTCQVWNGQRDEGTVSPHRIAEEHAQLPAGEAPLLEEGFRRTFFFGSPEALAAVRLRRSPLWSDRRDDCGPFDVIGSVHGRYGELVGLLKQLGYQLEPGIAHPRGRKLIFLGDLIDHGGRNMDVLRLVMRAVDAGAALSVPGNHEARLVRWLRGNKVDPEGGLEATIAELAGASVDFLEMLDTFLDGSVSHYVLDRGNLVVAHAGLKESLQGRGSAAVRAFALHGEAPGEDEGAASGGTPAWVEDYQGAARVVYSHPTVAEAVWRNGTVNVDTGAAAPGGRITAVRYPEMQLVSAPVGASMVTAAD